MWNEWEQKTESVHQVRLHFSWSGAITRREAHKAPVQRWRKNTSFQASWLGRASEWCKPGGCFLQDGSAPLFFPVQPSSFPPSPEQGIQTLQVADCVYHLFPFAVFPGPLSPPPVLARVLYLLCPSSLSLCSYQGLIYGWEMFGFSINRGELTNCLFNLYAEYIMRNAGLEEAQAGIKMLGKISITSDMQMTPPLWQKVKKN